MMEDSEFAANKTPLGPGAERRRHTRYSFIASAEAVELNSHAGIEGRTADLGRGGCYMDTMSPFPAKTMVTIRLRKENRSFEAQAEVTYSMPGLGMGLKFIAATSEHKSVIDKWIAELGGEATSEPAVATKPAEQVPVATRLESDPRWVLKDLIVELMHSGALPDEKAKALLQRLLACA